MTVLAITGHRLGPKLGGYTANPLGLAVQRALRVEIERIAPTKLISGMALGVDQWAAWTAVKLGVPFVAAVPFQGFDRKWTSSQRASFTDLIHHAQHVEVVCAPSYVPGKYQIRNEWMVDHCDLLLAVWDGSDSGTANCLRYAEKVGRPVKRIDPRVVFAEMEKV